MIDKNGNQLEIGYHVIYKGDTFEIVLNPFNNKVILDNPSGTVNIEDTCSNELQLCEDFQGYKCSFID